MRRIKILLLLPFPFSGVIFQEGFQPAIHPLNMNNSELLTGRDEAQPKNPAKELIYYLLTRHKMELQHLKSGQTLELLCYFDGFEIIPDSIGAINESTIHLEVLKNVKDGTITERRDWFVPIQKLSIRLDVRPKTNNKPPKEIGFHAITEQLKEV